MPPRRKAPGASPPTEPARRLASAPIQPKTSRGTWINLAMMIMMAGATAGGLFIYASGMVSDVSVLKVQVTYIQADVKEMKNDLKQFVGTAHQPAARGGP